MAPTKLTAVALLLATSACDVVAQVHIDELWFNPKLRADVEPLDKPMQATDSEDPRDPVVKQYISDGGSKGAEITSEVSLTRTGEFRTIPLRNAECLWVAPADEINLHWETAAKFTPLDTDKFEFAPGRDLVGACDYSHPFWREAIQDVDGTEYPIGPGDCKLDNAVRLRARVMPDYGAFFNAADACLGPQGAPADVATSDGDWCEPDSAGRYPNCNAEGCAFGVDADTQYELSATADGTGTSVLDWGPVLKRVSGTRQLVRPLKLNQNNATGSSAAFSWSVDELADGRWTENFSANLRLTRFRIFGLSPHGHRIYLEPATMEIGSGQCSASTRSDHSVACPGIEPSIIPMTPAYFHGVPDQRVQWTAIFAGDPREPGSVSSVGQCCAGTEEQCCDDGWCPPMCGDEGEHGGLQSDLYIEFTVVDLEHLAPDVFTSPTALDFGPVEWGASWLNHVVVENTGGMSVKVESADVKATAPGAFTATPAGGVTLPTMLAPGDTLLIDVTANSGGVGVDPEGTLTVRSTATNGAALESTTALRFLSYSGPQAVPTFVGQEAVGQMHFCPDAHRLPLVVANTGDRTLDRDAIHLEGPDAAAFTLSPIAPTVLGPDSLPKGDSDGLYVYFQPAALTQTQWDAQLVLESNARNLPGGRLEIDLVGFPEDSDQHASCHPYYNE